MRLTLTTQQPVLKNTPLRWRLFKHSQHRRLQRPVSSNPRELSCPTLPVIFEVQLFAFCIDCFSRWIFMNLFIVFSCFGKNRTIYRLLSECLNLDSVPLSSIWLTRMVLRGVPPTLPSATTKTMLDWKRGAASVEGCFLTPLFHLRTSL